MKADIVASLINAEQQDRHGQHKMADATMETTARMLRFAEGDDEQRDTFSIPESNMGKLQKRLDVLNKRGVRLFGSAFQPAVLTVLKEELVNINAGDDAKMEEYEKFFTVHLSGQQVKINGWTLLGLVDYLPEGAIVKSIDFDNPVPPEMIARFRTSKPLCEHCNLIRPRVKTFILQNDQGQVKQVGSTCLRDFLGHDTPQRLAEMAEFLASLRGEVESYEEDPEQRDGRTRSDYINLPEFLMHVNAMMRGRGYTSRTKAREFGGVATSDQAIDNMIKTKMRSATATPLEPEDEQAAKDAMLWLRKAFFILDEQGEIVRRKEMEELPDDFQRDMMTLLTTPGGASLAVHQRYLGYAAYLVQATKKTAEDARRSTEAVSEHQGEVGQKIKFVAKLISDRAFDTDYGTKTMYVFLDDQGNEYKWFTDNQGLQLDSRYEIMGTVKKHSDFRGKKQTELTRCKLRAVEEGVTAPTLSLEAQKKQERAVAKFNNDVASLDPHRGWASVTPEGLDKMITLLEAIPKQRKKLIALGIPETELPELSANEVITQLWTSVLSWPLQMATGSLVDGAKQIQKLVGLSGESPWVGHAINYTSGVDAFLQQNEGHDWIRGKYYGATPEGREREEYRKEMEHTRRERIQRMVEESDPSILEPLRQQVERELRSEAYWLPRRLDSTNEALQKLVGMLPNAISRLLPLSPEIATPALTDASAKMQETQQLTQQILDRKSDWVQSAPEAEAKCAVVLRMVDQLLQVVSKFASAQ